MTLGARATEPTARKKGGRPATGVGTPVMARIQPGLLAAIDAYGSPDSSRPEKCRQLMSAGISRMEAVNALLDALRRNGLDSDERVSRSIASIEQAISKASLS